jgi:hypothetical protein
MGECLFIIQIDMLQVYVIMKQRSTYLPAKQHPILARALDLSFTKLRLELETA